MPRLLSVLLNAYNLSLVKTIFGNLQTGLSPLFSKNEVTFTDNAFNYLPICVIDTENFSFIEKKEALSAISIRFDEAEVELTGFSAHFASKLIMLDFAYSQNFRLMNHLTNLTIICM